MVVSVLATYGVYLLSSFIACDPLHLLTSFLQYILLSPTYVNVLNVYAFCNLHDFSWGTKGDTTVSTDLGAVTATGKGVVEIVLEGLRNRDVVVNGLTVWSGGNIASSKATLVDGIVSVDMTHGEASDNVSCLGF